MTYIYNELGQKRKIEHLRAVQRLEQLKKESGSNPWPVIEECFKVWEDTNPTAWKAFLVNVTDTRNTRANKYASVYDKKNGGYLRYTLDIPEKVMYMIRCIYNEQELVMDKKFFHEFARRFPKYKVAEKI